MTSYPSALYTWTDRVDNVDDVMAADINNPVAEIIAIQTELGTDPAGSATDLATRLLRSVSAAGDLALVNVSTLTIASGSVTPVNNRHLIDTESAAASDDLDTINAVVNGFVLFLRIAADARNVVIRHNQGNIYCPGGANITLDTVDQICILIYDSGLSKWIAFSSAGFASLASANTWAGAQTFGAAENHKLTSVSANSTLDATHYTVLVDATGGTKTITLPAAASSTGRVYIIKRVNSGANTVVVDGNASETIDGATTYTLTSQYQTITIQCDGSNWYIL